MNIESKKVNLTTSQKEIFEFLGDMNNFVQLLPQDKISDWKSNQKSCSFKIQGMATIEMILKESDNFKHHIVSGDKSPFPFTLDVFVEKTGLNTGCIAYNVFKGDLNPFLRMMAEKPLTNLFNYIADRLIQVKG